MTPVLALTDAPDQTTEDVIGGGLARYNEQHAGYRDSRPLAVLISDGDTREVLGGLLGHTSLGLLFIDVFFIPEHLRRHGLATRIIQQAEDEARRHQPRRDEQGE